MFFNNILDFAPFGYTNMNHDESNLTGSRSYHKIARNPSQKEDC